MTRQHDNDNGSLCPICNFPARNCPHELRNARFWVFANGGAVKLTLKPGQELTHCSGGPNEEGYSYETTTWRNEGRGGVERIWGVQACDCDGRLDQGGEDFAPFGQLAVREPYGSEFAGVRWPQWQLRLQEQRDYNAEAMGY